MSSPRFFAPVFFENLLATRLYGPNTYVQVLGNLLVDVAANDEA